MSGCTCFQAITAARAAQTQDAITFRFDVATALLRADVWQASSLLVDSKQLVALQPNGVNIVWKIGPGDQLTRSTQRWSNLGMTTSIAIKTDGWFKQRHFALDWI